MTEDKKKEDEIVVVRELPSQPIKDVKGEDGKEYHLLTMEEAVGEILKIVKDIKKNIG